MGYRKINECMDCVECISCSRYERYSWEFYCDKCGIKDVELFNINAYQLCEDCASRVLAIHQKGICEDCKEVDYLFEISDKKVCELCMKEYLQEI